MPYPNPPSYGKNQQDRPGPAPQAAEKAVHVEFSFENVDEFVLIACMTSLEEQSAVVTHTRTCISLILSGWDILRECKKMELFSHAC